MSTGLKISYDAPSDTLYLDLDAPRAEQESRSVARGVLARIDPETQRVETLEFLNFLARFEKGDLLELPMRGFITAERPGRTGRSRLTKRESEVASLIESGLSAKDIASQAGVSEESVQKLVSGLVRKLRSPVPAASRSR